MICIYTFLYDYQEFADRKAILNFTKKSVFSCNFGNESPNPNACDWVLTDQWGRPDSRAALLTVDINQGSRWGPSINRITQQPWGLWSSFCSSELLVSVKFFSCRSPSFLLTVCWPLCQNIVQNNHSISQRLWLSTFTQVQY